METDREHPGKTALRSLREMQAQKSQGERSSVVAVLEYLDERLDHLEKILADRNRAFVPPAPKEVTAYARTIGFELDGEAFCDFYSARGWCIGKVKMKSWEAAVRTWKKYRAEQAPLNKPARMPDNLTEPL